MEDKVVKRESKDSLFTGAGNTKTSSIRKVLPICILCNTVPEEGIRSGFFLKGIFICSCCENELINSRPENTEKYREAITKLRKILIKEKPW